MKCKNCTNETDNTSGLCWECLTKWEKVKAVLKAKIEITVNIII